MLLPGEWKGFDYGGDGRAADRRPARSRRPSSPSTTRCPTATRRSCPPPPTDGDEERWIYFTSGTTSDPKGVRHSDRTLLAGGRGMAEALQMTPDDVGSIAFPFAHIAGPDYLVTVLAQGFPAVFFESFVPDQAVPTLARNGVTMVGGSTAFYQLYLNEQRKQPDDPIIPTLRIVSGGGAPMPPEIFDEVQRELGVRVCHGYGMTEIPMICQGSPHDTDEQLRHSVGAPVYGAEIRIVTDKETEAAPGRGRRGAGQGPDGVRGLHRRRAHRRGVRRRRLVPHRRPRPRPSRRPRRAHRPPQGRHHPQGREHLGQARSRTCSTPTRRSPTSPWSASPTASAASGCAR